KTLDAFIQRVNSGPANSNSEPFRIQDYAQAAERIDAASQRLVDLLRTLDATLGSTNLSQLNAQIGPVVDRASASGKQTVDYVFRKAVWLLVIACALVLVTAQANRLLNARRTPPPADNAAGNQPATSK